MTDFTDSTYNEVITLRKQVDSLFNLVETLARVLESQGERIDFLGKVSEKLINKRRDNTNVK